MCPKMSRSGRRQKIPKVPSDLRVYARASVADDTTVDPVLKSSNPVSPTEREPLLTCTNAGWERSCFSVHGFSMGKRYAEPPSPAFLGTAMPGTSATTGTTSFSIRSGCPRNQRSERPLRGARRGIA